MAAVGQQRDRARILDEPGNDCAGGPLKLRVLLHLALFPYPSQLALLMFSLLARKPWYLLLLPMAVLAAAMGWRSAGAGLGAEGEEMAPELDGNAPLVAVVTLPPPLPEHADSSRVGPGLALDPRAGFERGQGLFSYARQLRAAAATGDADATWMLSRIYDYCGAYAMDPLAYAADAPLLATLKLDAAPGLLAARERVRQGCEGFTAADGLGSALSAQQRQAAAKAGSLAAEAALLAMGRPLQADADYQRGLVERVLNAQDPEAFLAISPAMGVAASGNEAYAGKVAGTQLSQLAWQVAACRLGLACGPDSALMTAYCANGGVCSRNPRQDFETFVYDAAVPRQGVETMNDMVNSLIRKPGAQR